MVAEVARPIVAALVDKVPVLGQLVELYGIGESVSDQIFLAKVRRFIEGLAVVGGAEARAFADEIHDDPEMATRAAEAVLLSLNAITDLEKAPVLAYIYAAYLRDEISFETLRRLLNAVNQAMVEDLWALAEEPAEEGKWAGDVHARRLQAIHALRTTGLAQLSDSAFLMAGKRSFIGNEVTPLGTVLIEILRAVRRAEQMG